MRKFVYSLIVATAFAGCSDASIAQLGALGEPGHITCYSGGKVIYEGRSTGKIISESQTDGWFFMDDSTKSLVRVSGDCVIRN